MKKCSCCGILKSRTEFYKSKSGQQGLYAHCKRCQNQKVSAWRRKNPDRANELSRASARRHRPHKIAYSRQYYRLNRSELLKKAKIDQTKLRDEVLARYGGKCACCGESRREFLAIDHIQNNGHKHRKEMKTQICNWLKNHKWPDGFQVLCHNCNWGKRLNGGICPHQKAEYGLRIVEL